MTTPNADPPGPDERTRQMAPYERAIASSRPRFVDILGETEYLRESVFAAQAVLKTDYSLKVANQNPVSVQMALINAASTGLTLNPAHGYAYLVPRDGAIVLDISYRGLIKIATDAGSILWARCELVYEGDAFVYHGPARAPEHTTDPFKKDRPPLIGAYCIAKTVEGDILCDTMPVSELEKIRGKSDLYRIKKSGPWVEWFEQMCKKAMLKRARHYWPHTNRLNRFDDAVAVQNELEGGYTLNGEVVEPMTGEEEGRLRAALAESNVPEERFLEWARTATKLDVRTVADLPQAFLAKAFHTIAHMPTETPRPTEKAAATKKGSK